MRRTSHATRHRALLTMTILLGLSALGLAWLSAGPPPLPSRAANGPRATGGLAAPFGSTTIVLSEFRTRGPGGASDEFIELYNLSPASVNISGWLIRGSNNTGGTSTRLTINAGTTLNPGCHFLATNSGGYSGGVAGDQTYA